MYNWEIIKLKEWAEIYLDSFNFILQHVSINFQK